MNALRKLWPLTLILLGACQTMSAAYRIDPQPHVDAAAPVLRVVTLEDLRSEEEKTGAGAGMFNRSTKDSLYGDKVNEAITLSLVDELRRQGIDARSTGSAPYTLTGEVTSYRAMIVPPRTAFIPYLSYVTWMWSNDELVAGVGVNLRVERADGVTVYDKSRNLADDKELWVGLAGLASSMRRMDREELVRFLQAGLKEELTAASADIAAEIRAHSLTY